MKSIGLATAAIALAWSTLPALAEDAAAQFTVALFDQACMQNFGHLDRVGDWALNRDLAPIENPMALQVFMGYRVSARTHEHSVAGGGVLNLGRPGRFQRPQGASSSRRASTPSSASCGRRPRIRRRSRPASRR